ncbi:Predicted DNA-binding transcriptional regulator YafY, contains an HTH and WYL domains [Natronincola peptidivorans]|uniref:Predicted DNA-binding transcriptional regulator YafY, contains an HTH and WYL domains n=1 Tax=Natronincola peptidivorans TaxID=426128 RepID=A0A1I0EM06_9FIRM|nr:WYL domain-containing protein [Natronincola peptidivorans]SET45780.1 Predicted DNA-binding transcriptional regulator YafY, contains an HTH and WYL domains [Natronincola peptidivorans]
MPTKANKSEGLLEIYHRLLNGDVVKKGETADELGVNPKTISRYVADINAYLSNTGKLEHIRYSRKEKGYVLESDEEEILNSKEILTISKILLESRGLSKRELDTILRKLLDNCCTRDKAYIKKLVINEMENYVEPKHGENLIDKIWSISEAINCQRMIEIRYTKLGENGKIISEPIDRKLQPEAILFSEYYFYLIAFMKDKPFKYPTIYRLDRIKDYKVLKEGFKINYKDRFKEGEFRNLVQFMQPGELQTIKFVFRGKSIEAVLDRLPNAEIIKQKEAEYLVKTEVFGQGIKMWLLSQGKDIKIIEPRNFIEDMEDIADKLLKQYKHNKEG